MLTFQEIITKLQEFWTSNGCVLQQSYDIETGAGTFNPETFLRSLGPEPYNVCNVEISKRPTDGRYGKNPNRLQKFHQFQVLLKPSPANIQSLYLKSLEAIGLSLKDHDFRFVHDDWESPTQGAWGLGWEVWCDGMEVTQFTYFQCIGGVELSPVPVELAYGIERIAMFLQGVSNVYDVQYNQNLKYGDVFLQSEIEFSKYNFEQADISMWRSHFENFEKESNRLLELGNPIVAYDFAIKASHAFNMMDARGAVSTSARVDLMHKIRNLACNAANAYIESRKSLGFPLLKPTESIAPPPPAPPQDVKFSPTETDELLLEIGTEELPAAFVPAAAIQLEAKTKTMLDELNLSYEEVKVYATARRLTVHVIGLSCGTEEQIIERKGPAIKSAFDESGTLTAQGKGFLQSIGIGIVNLTDVKMGKIASLSIREETHLFARELKPGKSTAELVFKPLQDLILSMTFPKTMRWGENSISFARPIRWIVALFGKKELPITVGDITASRYTFGHAQMCNQRFKISHPSKYLKKLKRYYVLANPSQRQQSIELQLNEIEEKHSCKILDRERVLNEVLYLSEYPFLATYHFDKEYLALPGELLKSEMIDHQRYFPTGSEKGIVSNLFVVACDRKPTETILKNNQAVLIARLSDGLFLYESDLRKPIHSFNESLKEIVFHKQLGSVYEKTKRICELTKKLSKIFEISPPLKAAELCKADLASAVVNEFPELQGVMGKYYARAAKESEDTALAIEEHWWPISEGAPIPTSIGGRLIALADKIDNLESYMKIGIKPTSSKDPYALRRSAIGIIRILIESKMSLNLSTIIENVDVLDFIRDRIKGILRDSDYKKDEIEAVISPQSNDPFDIYCRVSALHKFRKSSTDFDKLYQIYKRAKGQIGENEVKVFNSNLVQEDGERHLSEALENMKPKFDWAINQKDYLDAFKTLSTLNEPLSHFFDNVRVLAEDPKVRDNRIALLQCVFDHTRRLIDFNRI